MIIDYKQNKSNIDISYVTDNLNIEVVTVPLKSGYYQYVACDDWDEEKIPNRKSLYGSSFKKESSNKFRHHNINEFFSVELKNDHPEVYSLVNKLKIPSPFSIDIETEITDEFGYSTSEKVENKILSISITDKNLSTIVLQLKNPNKPEVSPEDLKAIENFVNTALNNIDGEKEYIFAIRQFDTEYDMLNNFIELINKYFHSMIGWNVEGFDFPWIYNRCLKIGVDITKASPKGTIVKKMVDAQNFGKGVKKDENVEVEKVTRITPDHRLQIDYMNLFKGSLVYGSMDSYSLSNVSKALLGLDKVQYSGNLRKLYNDDPNKFVAYAILDTILVMMLHLKTNLYAQNFFESNYNNIPYNSIAQNVISDALVYNELASKGKFLLSSEHTQNKKRSYKGGYVKTPTRKLCSAVGGIDFSSLYPSSMITNNLSPENKIDRLKLKSVPGDFDIVFANKEEEDKWKEYYKQGCTISVMGNIYKPSDDGEDGLYVAIEKKLLGQRKVFRTCGTDIYLNLAPKIEKLIAEKQKEKELSKV